ncbi:hypothetical protein Poli38472_011731 [Pythium oligandrum]|uniref:Protein kinase domain-containing protein n=1 Tax=Pythium oligandrum TaxID=41045 RepID=A0A8K1C831_PYTOL|nr:hypothetical protein Poli38472_011731 [Pythium oligandrum]|eukprot:TMW58143.1 hypothetical protein Poli38472_011731 [Pythium oligandrum]
MAPTSPLLRRCVTPLVLHEKLTITHNAALYRARPTQQPSNSKGSTTTSQMTFPEFVVVKDIRLATMDSVDHRYSDDPMQELRVATRLLHTGGHPNVVRFYGAYLESDAVRFVMEDCQSGDLYDHLKRQPEHRLPQRDALNVLLHVTRGLRYLHKLGFAHRDVSIENVLIGPDGQFKLCDFGLSSSADVVCLDTVGKSHYMAPEVVAKQSPYDPVRADIWALGILLFTMLTGSPLVQVASPTASEFQAFRLVGCRGVLNLWKLDHLVGFATVDLLDRMLEPDPSKRLRSTAEILEHPALLAAAARELNVSRTVTSTEL